MRYSTAAKTLVLTVLVPACAALASDGIIPTGSSFQSSMRGGADVAVGDSAISQVDNPAALALSPRDMYTFDVAPKIDYAPNIWKSPIDTDSSKSRVFLLGNGGLTIPVNDRLTLGLAEHFEAGYGSRFNIRPILFPYMNRRFYSDLKIIDLSLNAGYKVTDKLSAGLGLRFAGATEKFGAPVGPVDFDFGRGYAWGGGFSLGLHYKATDKLSFGLAYRSPTWLSDLEGGSAKASLLGALPVPLGDASIPGFRLPQRITFGSAYDLTKRIKLVNEIRWINWNNSVFHYSTMHADGLIHLRYPLPLSYTDQWAFIQGADIKLTDHWILGLGYHFCTRAVPPAGQLPIASVITQHHLSAGLRYEQKKWWAGAGYLLAFPIHQDGVGHTRLPLGVDFGVSRIEQAQHAICLGFGYRW